MQTRTVRAAAHHLNALATQVDSRRPRGPSTPGCLEHDGEGLGLGEPRRPRHLQPVVRRRARRPGRCASGNSSGVPNVSRSPWTTRVGTPTCSSSAGDFSGRPGGCSGNDSARHPAAPSSRRVRAADRAPAQRPPSTSGVRARSWSTAAARAASSVGRRRWRSSCRRPATAARRAPRVTPCAGQRRGQRQQVARVDAAAGTVAEQQGRDRPARAAGDQPALALRAWDDRSTALMLAASSGRPVPDVLSGRGSTSSGPLLRTLSTSVATG